MFMFHLKRKDLSCHDETMLLLLSLSLSVFPPFSVLSEHIPGTTKPSSPGELWAFGGITTHHCFLLVAASLEIEGAPPLP
jgi:hypothetical protein